METTFKCCKKKEFNNLICANCFDVYHRACLERKKFYKLIGGPKICCSDTCQREYTNQKTTTDDLLDKISKLKADVLETNVQLESKQNQMEDEIHSRELIIGQLRNELMEKDRFIERLRRDTEMTVNEMVEMEEQDTLRLKEQRDVIARLNTSLLKLDNDKELLQEELTQSKTEMESLKREIGELIEISKSMMETIRVLEEENNMYCKELDRLRNSKNLHKSVSGSGEHFVLDEQNELILESRKQEVCDMNIVSHAGGKPKTGSGRLEASYRNVNELKKNKILVLCDDGGRNLGKFLSNMLGHDYFVQTVMKPGASLADVVSGIESLTKNFTMNDFVIILGGLNDILRGKYPSFRLLNKKLKQLQHTNLIAVTIPLHIRPEYYFYITKFNNKLENYMIHLDRYLSGRVSTVGVDGIKGSAMKRLIAVSLSNEIKHGRKRNNNLVHIVQTVHDIQSVALNDGTFDGGHTSIDVTLDNCIIDDLVNLDVQNFQVSGAEGIVS